MNKSEKWGRELKNVLSCTYKNLSLDDTLFLLDEGLLPQPSFEDFLSLLHKCRRKRSSSWNSLISEYIRCGKPHLALSLYQEMQKDNSVKVSKGQTFIALLKACAKLKTIEQGMEIHEEVSRLGLLERDHFLGSTLVDMYAKCGSLVKAREVFSELLVKDVVSWTALIRGYVEHGHGKLALECFQQMQLEGIPPDAVTFICCLKACSSLRDKCRGQDIHAEIEKRSILETDLNVGNTLVDMYVKCGSMIEAEHVFDKLLIRDVVSWTALIAGYTEIGQGMRALECYEEMQVEGVSANSATFVCCLKASASIQDLGRGCDIHAEVERTEIMEKDLVVGNMVIDMYIKCSALNLAQEVFQMRSIQDVVSWTTMILGYAEHGQGEAALKYFEQMQSVGIQPNPATYVCALKSCASVRAIDKGLELHDQIKREGILEKDCAIGTALIDMYAKCGQFAEAQKVFDNLSDQDVVSWNALITGYAECGLDEVALQNFEQMQLEGVSADSVTYICSFKACMGVKSIVKAQALHVQALRKGLLERDLAVGTALVDVYAKCGKLVKAREVFDRLLIRDVVSWTALTVSYVDHGCGEQALNCLEQMQLQGITPNSATLVCSLKACSSIGAIDKGKELHAELERKGLLEKDIAVGNTLIDMYGKFNLLALAQQVFDNLSVRDVVSWNSLIAGYIQQEQSAALVHVFERMLSDGMDPNPVTFLIVLNACSRIGLLSTSQTYFQAMSRDFGIVPSIEHCTSMINLYFRAGRLNQAISMMNSIPTHLNPLVWRTVLSSCKTCTNMEFGYEAFSRAAGLQ